jgi:hypothetical protein
MCLELFRSRCIIDFFLKQLFYGSKPFVFQDAQYNAVSSSPISQWHMISKNTFFNATDRFHGFNTLKIIYIGAKLASFQTPCFENICEQKQFTVTV